MWTNHLLLLCKTVAMLLLSRTLITLDFCTVMLFSAFFFAAVRERKTAVIAESGARWVHGWGNAETTFTSPAGIRKKIACRDRERTTWPSGLRQCTTGVSQNCCKTSIFPMFMWPKPNKPKPDKYQCVLDQSENAKFVGKRLQFRKSSHELYHMRNPRDLWNNSGILVCMEMYRLKLHNTEEQKCSPGRRQKIKAGLKGKGKKTTTLSFAKFDRR